LPAGCNIALYYHSGFCYLMLRRYLDAARAFNTVLNYILRCAPDKKTHVPPPSGGWQRARIWFAAEASIWCAQRSYQSRLVQEQGISDQAAVRLALRRVKQYHQGSAQYEHILKKNEQMYALTAVTLALCPAAQRELDENVLLTLREKYAHIPEGLPEYMLTSAVCYVGCGFCQSLFPVLFFGSHCPRQSHLSVHIISAWHRGRLSKSLPCSQQVTEDINSLAFFC
jgi:hypothetical protein